MNEKKEKREKVKGRGNNPNSRKNLNPIAKGEIRNPFGKKKGTKDRKSVLDKWLPLTVTFKNETEDAEKIFADLPQEFEVTVEDTIAFALIAEAKNGNVNAIREIFDAKYGKIVEKQELTGKDGKDLLPQKFILERVDKPEDVEPQDSI